MISAVYGWLKSSGLELAANAFVAAIMVLVARRLTLWLWSHLECWIQFKAHQRSLEIAKNVFLAKESSNGNNRWMWWWYRLFPKNALQTTSNRQMQPTPYSTQPALCVSCLKFVSSTALNVMR